jgi:predicted double-glycine peptidase
MDFKHWLIEHETIKVPVKNVKQQKDYSCGAAVLKSVLNYYGIKVSEPKVHKVTKTNKKGTQTKDIISAA